MSKWECLPRRFLIGGLVKPIRRQLPWLIYPSHPPVPAHERYPDSTVWKFVPFLLEVARAIVGVTAEQNVVRAEGLEPSWAV